MRHAVVSLLAVLASGCFGNTDTPFVPTDAGPPSDGGPDYRGLAALEPNLASPPAPQDGNPYPEELVLVDSMAIDAPRTPAVHARGYVQAPVSAVWAALQIPDVNADRRALTSYTTMPVEPTSYDAEYVIHAVVVNVITIEYEQTWRHARLLGTEQAPAHVAMSWQKTWGSSALSDLRGWIELREVAPGVTEIAMIEYLNAVTQSHPTIRSFFHDLFREVVIVAHGGTVPLIADLPPITM
ncbi:MAG: hypothetical protein IT378_23665 [Sandaracinaceae bacterium]|nr:hypothetical protein [Sandaracinaceae bacterium]